MDARHFDTLSRALSTGNTRRHLLALLATLPLLGGLVAILDPEDMEAAGRRKRRKKAHKHGRGRRRKGRGKKKCKAHPVSRTCAGTCGSVTNNCKKPVDCGPCDCSPACGECFTCQGRAGAPGTCVPQEAGTACGAAATCDSGTLFPRGSCDGAENCLSSLEVSCDPYIQCDGNACATSCTTDNDCVAGSFCNESGRCVGDGDFGQPCTRDGQCASGYCADGVCCENACDAVCFACNVPGDLGACIPDPAELGDTCGEVGQVCQADGGCRCTASSCPACTTCGGDGLCAACADCCDAAGVCQDGDTEAACGSSGTCKVCTGQEQCQGQTCVCVPITTCPGGKNCGTISDGCGGDLSCGTCANPTPVCTSNVCVACTSTAQCSNGLACVSGSCQACTSHAQCGANQICDSGTCHACTVCASGCPRGRVQDAITFAAAGDTIYICPGTYGLSSATSSGAAIAKPLTLVGAGISSTILSGGGVAEASSVVDCASAPVELRDLTVTGGNTNSLGGGISVAAGTQLTLTRVSVTGNMAGTGGGGMFIAGTGSVTLNATAITANSAGFGGGVLNQGTLTVNAGSSITGNNPDQCVNSAGGTGCP